MKIIFIFKHRAVKDGIRIKSIVGTIVINYKVEQKIALDIFMGEKLVRIVSSEAK